MSPETETLIRDGLALDEDQRAVVANALLVSFGDDMGDSDHDEEWSNEARRRFADVMNGRVQLIDADEHCASLRMMLAP